MSETKITELSKATNVNINDSVLINQNGVTKMCPISLLPTGSSVSEYTIRFEDAYQTQVAKNTYGSTSNISNNTKYLYDALINSLSLLNSHGGGTLLFEKMYTYNGSVKAWQIDNVNNITFKGVGEAGFQKPSDNIGRFGFIRHCNNLKFLNMTFIGSRTTLSGLQAGDYGLEIHSGDTIIIEECTFKNMNDACLVVGNETSSETDGLDCTKNVWVNKCKFYNTWQTSTTQNGVYNYWFTNNYIKGGSSKFAQRLPNGDNIYIKDNVYIATDNFIGNLIEVCNYDNVIIENNRMTGVSGVTDCGISIYYNTHASTDYYSTHKNITIRGNKIYDCKAGMWLGHAVSTYPGGRLYIENNSVMGNISNRAITLSGYWQTIIFKDNYFKDLPWQGIVIGQSGGSGAKIERLYIENNVFINTTGTSIHCTENVGHFKIVNNDIENGSSNNVIVLGDGTNSITTDLLEVRDNRIKSSASGKSCIVNNNMTVTTSSIKNNIITSASYGIQNFKATTVFFSGNYIKSSNSCLMFTSSSSGNVYTVNNIVTSEIILNGMTETKK